MQLRNLVLFILALPLLSACGNGAESPYTVFRIDKGVYRIEDSNSQNPAGEQFDGEGKLVSSNNCSDMYLFTGRDRALLVDLSNKLDWADNAAEALVSQVKKLCGRKPLTISFTHNHNDHMGMLYAFQNQADVTFALPRTDFSSLLDLFPEDRSYVYDEGHCFDLGGLEVETLKVSGHTPGSVVYFVKDKNLAITGDAIGSGHGVWIFSKPAFEQYIDGFTALLTYLDESGIDKDKLRLFGGHYWQRDWCKELGSKELGIDYIRDMQELIGLICRGEADFVPSNLNFGLVDTYYCYGSAIVASNQSLKEYYK